MLFPSPAYTSFTIPTGATTGARITFNEGGNGLILVYNSAGTVVDQIGGGSGAILSKTTAVFVELVNGTVYVGQMASGVPDAGHAASIAASSGGVGTVTYTGASDNTNTAVGVMQWVAGVIGSTLSSATVPFINVTSNDISSTPLLITLGGALAYQKSTGTESWQTPSYTASWGAGTTFSGVSGFQSLRFRRTIQDTVRLEGVFTVTAAGAGATVFMLPSGYFNAGAIQPIPVMYNASGTTSPKMGMGYVGTTGNFHIDLGEGFTRNSGDQFSVAGEISLANLP